MKILLEQLKFSRIENHTQEQQKSTNQKAMKSHVLCVSKMAIQMAIPGGL